LVVVLKILLPNHKQLLTLSSEYSVVVLLIPDTLQKTHSGSSKRRRGTLAMWGYPMAWLAFSGPGGGPTCGTPLADLDINPHTPGLGSTAGSSIDQCCALCSSANW